MARMDWDADRGRRMIAPQRREAAVRFMDWIIEARIGPVIPEPVKKRKPRRKAKPARARKPKSLMLHQVKKPPARKMLVDPRAKMLEQRRIDARAARAARVALPLSTHSEPDQEPIEHLGADMALALRD